MLNLLRPLPIPVAALQAGAALLPITITSSATFSAAENQTAVATLTASGGTGSYTWTKVGGADTAKFSLSGGGVLTFASAPDFEVPTDANTDNVYLVQVQADDGVSTPATQSISVTVTDVVETTTFNPSDKSANITLAAGNLQVTASTTSVGGVRTIASDTSGKFYFEVKWTSPSGGSAGAGIASSAAILNTGGLSWPGNGTGGLIAFVGGTVFSNGSSAGISLGALVTNDVLCFAIDLTNLRAWVRKNGGNWNNSGTANPATNVGGVNISTVFTSNAAYGTVSINSTTSTALANFGATAFAQTVPSGFSAGPT